MVARNDVSVTALQKRLLKIKGSNYFLADFKVAKLKDAKSITLKNGKPATQRTCPTCGTKMFRIGKS